MYIINKEKKELFKSNIFALEYFTDNTDNFNCTEVLSLNDIKFKVKDYQLNDEIYEKAKELFKSNVFLQAEFIKDFNIFVYAYNEKDITSITIHESEEKANIFASEIANDILKYNDINEYVLSNTDELLDYFNSLEVKDDFYYEIKNFIKELTLEPNKATQQELADYLGVSKSAVSQYNTDKKDLMLKGLGLMQKYK